MKLKDKGQFLPPPNLSIYSQMVSTEIQAWKNIIAATHWHFSDNKKVDGADFYFGEFELGHIHLDGSMHLATNKELKIVLLKTNLAQNFPFGKNWISFDITSAIDVKQALFLFELNYEMLTGASHQHLVLKIENYIADKSNTIKMPKTIQSQLDF
jgi:hypothetical protein